jgi:FSR family fosmidomycin resistance protein-like MFS transporter
MGFARTKTRPPRGVRTAWARFTRRGLGALYAALAVELVDELVDGTKSAAMPLIRHDLSLSYLQIGLLAAVPLLVGSVLELPVGVLSGTGPRRRRLVLAGGLIFIASVLAAGLATSFTGLLIALTIFFPASGMFVSLTQAGLMDSAPDRQAQHMARWTLAGSIGAVTGPVLVAVILGAGGTWRLAFIVIAGCSVAAWCAIARTSRATNAGTYSHPGAVSAVAESPTALAAPPAAEAPAARAVTPAATGVPSVTPDAPAATPTASAAAGDDDGEGDGDGDGAWPGWRAAVLTVRRSGALRWLMLLEVANLLLDVLTPFLALYLVTVDDVSPSVAALGVAVRLGAGLAGDVILIRVLARRDSRRLIRASVWATLALLPTFLVVPGLGLKLVALAALTIATAPWYPVLQAELYGSLPGRSGLVVSLTSASGLAAALGPLAVGLLAQTFGLSWAMASLCIVPVLMLAVVPRRDSR